MKRSEINRAYDRAMHCLKQACWALPPNPKWDITDCGTGDFTAHGISLVNLAEELEYSEKIICMWKPQEVVIHTHNNKKEDIICRWGRLRMQLWNGHPSTAKGSFRVNRNGVPVTVESGVPFFLEAGERMTLVPGIYHAFGPDSEECVVGEVSTFNDDANDNVFANPSTERFPEIEEDEPARVKLIGDHGKS